MQFICVRLKKKYLIHLEGLIMTQHESHRAIKERHCMLLQSHFFQILRLSFSWNSNWICRFLTLLYRPFLLFSILFFSPLPPPSLSVLNSSLLSPSTSYSLYFCLFLFLKFLFFLFFSSRIVLSALIIPLSLFLTYCFFATLPPHLSAFSLISSLH